MKETDAYKAVRLAPLQMGCESLSLILAAHLAMLTALLASPRYSATKVLRAANEIGRIIRRQLKIQYRLTSQALQGELKVNPAFRAQVARDLGGKLAMVRWERRRRDAKTRAAFKAARQAQGFDLDQSIINYNRSLNDDLINSDFAYDDDLINSSASSNDDLINFHAPSSSPEDNPHSKHASRASERKRWQAVIDRTGHFRWAVIASGPRKKPRKIIERIVKINRAANRPFQPHGVTADDLRAPAFPTPEFGPPTYSPDIGMPVAGVSPPIERWPKEIY